jgi:ribosomal subunit interface protein
VLNVEITADGYELSDDLRQRAVDKFGALGKYMSGLEQVHVVFAWSSGKGEQTSVRAQVDGGGHRFEASATDWKAETALDRTQHELETQIRREKSKEIDKRDHRG